MRWLICVGVLVACAQFVYLAVLISQQSESGEGFALRGREEIAVVESVAPIVRAVTSKKVAISTEMSKVSRRIVEIVELVNGIHRALPRPKSGFGIKNSPHRATDAEVWQAFYTSLNRMLYTTESKQKNLKRHERTFLKEKDTIFVSVSSFRDEVCPNTLSHMFLTATHPDKIAVGLVQQNCDENQHKIYGCFTAIMPEDMKAHPAPPDLDCANTFCNMATTKNSKKYNCDILYKEGRLRILRFNESQTFGPVFGRYLGSLLWFQEHFYMQVDAHTTFAHGWDTILLHDYALAPSKKAIFSHYPPSGPQQPGPLANNRKYNWELAPGVCMCDAGFAEYDILRVGAMQRYPFTEYYPPGCQQNSLSSSSSLKDTEANSCFALPRFSPFIGAGFVFGNASFLFDVPFDPFTPFIFMGEELDFSTRLWTAGWDLFCPPRSVLAHAYLRKQKPKFWGALQRSIGAGAHNSLQAYVLPRVKLKVGYPNIHLNQDSLAAHFDDFGLGSSRPLSDYLRIADLDFTSKRHADVSWCKAGQHPPLL